jgi:hypothetical protein
MKFLALFPLALRHTALIRIAVYVVAATIILLWIPISTTQSVTPLDKSNAPRARFVPGEVLVRFRSETAAKTTNQVERQKDRGMAVGNTSDGHLE